MKTVIIRFYEKGETPKRATITYSGKIPSSEMEKLQNWGFDEEEAIHKAKTLLTINVIPSS
ncbi:MAG: hypothetical protein K6T73_11365 [Candidatus Bathyarchaeota archaeon]|nr:hypothetical protein [Candidatus Bathyarchaeota archaeon]